MKEKEGIVGYNGSQFRIGMDKVKRSKEAIEKLPVPHSLKIDIFNIAANIVNGTFEATDAINNPFHTREEIYSAAEKGASIGSPSDHITDSKYLREITVIFDPQFKDPQKKI